MFIVGNRLCNVYIFWTNYHHKNCNLISFQTNRRFCLLLLTSQRLKERVQHWRAIMKANPSHMYIGIGMVQNLTYSQTGDWPFCSPEQYLEPNLPSLSTTLIEQTKAGTNVKSTMVLVCLQSRMRQTWLLTVSTGLMARISFCDQTKNESKAFQMFPFLSFCISESLDCFTFSPSSKNTSNKPYMNWLYLPDNISHRILFPDPPFIFVPPTNTATNETNTVTLLCVLEGKPQPVVTWEKYGVPLSIDGGKDIDSTSLGVWQNNSHTDNKEYK